MLVRITTRVVAVFTMLLALSAFGARRLHAQGGLDIIVGVVTDADGKPVGGATVEAVSIETDVKRAVTTNDKGQYRIIFTDGTGSYRVSVKAIGKTPKIFNVTRQSDDDRIVLNVNLGAQVAKLTDLVSNARRNVDPNAQENRPTAAEQSRSISGDQALKMPIDAGDLAALAALAPGVVLTGGSDSTAATFSVAGQSAAGNTYVVNGQTTSSSSVPQDAVRSTRVITNSYDVARGNFSGGLVSVTTKGGSNRPSGSVSSQLQDQSLAFGGNTSNAFGAGQTRGQLGAGFGGPIKRDKLWLFAAFSANRQVSPIPSLDNADAATLLRLGASPDSVAKFTQIVAATGLTNHVGVVNPNRKNDALTGVSRLDWNLGSVHSMTFTGQVSLGGQDPARINSTQLPQVGGTTDNNSLAGNLAINSRFLNGMVNQFKLGYTWSDNTSTPFLLVPAGRVTNYSPVDSGVVPVTLGFGGNPGMPNSSTNKSTEFTNELSLISPQGSHRWALGLYGNTTSFEQNSTNNQFGTFTYNSLADFSSNTASSFTRTLSPSTRDGSVYNEAVYLSDAWRPRIGGGANNNNAGGQGGGRGGRGGGPGGGNGGNLQLNYGVRVEHTSYSGAPARNDAVFNEFGVDTHQLPEETYVSPRVGFSYSIAAPEQQGQAQRGFAPPLLTIRGGAGIFRATMPSTLPALAQAQSGLPGAQTQLFCTGAAVPTANFSDYINNPQDIPSECLDNQSTPVITGTPSVTTYDKDYGAAKTKRLSLGLTRRLNQRVTFNVDASYVRGVGQAASRDLNLVDAPRFTIGNEDNRPVYADPAQIVPITGQVPLAASRKDVNYSAVTEVFSTLQNETKQITFSVQGTTAKQIQLNLAYTLMGARDQGGTGGGLGGFGGSNITSGDPNVYQWGTSSNDRRHNFQVTVGWPVNPAFELDANLGMVSGTPYTPVVAGDINGDGSSRNDAAFIFNPATTSDTALANGMSRLLAQTSGNAKSCLQAQSGTIASRNTCYGPWQPRMDLAINFRPALFDRRLAVKVSTQNLLGGLDELIHGDNNIKGWGGNARPDNTLLTVTGFNQATNTFVYSVNQRFGNTSSAATATRSPFQLLVGLNYAIGYDQRTQQIQALARGMGGAATGSAALDTATVRFKKVNVAQAALDRKDSLALSKEQLAQLTALVDSVNKAFTHLADSIRPAIDKMTKAGSAGDFNTFNTQVLRPFSTQSIALLNAAKSGTQKILTEVQWAVIPDSAKTIPFSLFINPNGGPGGPGGPGGGGGGRGGFGGGGRGGE